MSSFLSTASQVALFIFSCPRGYSRPEHTIQSEKPRDIDHAEERLQPKFSIVASEELEKAEIRIETEELPPYEATRERTALPKAALAPFTSLSIIHPKPFMGPKVDQNAFVDPRDQEAARLAEEEDALYVLKEKSTIGATDQNRKPSRIRRLKSKLDPRPKNSSETAQ